MRVQSVPRYWLWAETVICILPTLASGVAVSSNSRNSLSAGTSSLAGAVTPERFLIAWAPKVESSRSIAILSHVQRHSNCFRQKLGSQSYMPPFPTYLKFSTHGISHSA